MLLIINEFIYSSSFVVTGNAYLIGIQRLGDIQPTTNYRTTCLIEVGPEIKIA